MKKIAIFLLIASIGASPVASAMETTHFKAKTTRDLVTLCDADEGNPMYDVAMGYCLGFVHAAIAYHRTITSGDLLEPIACPDHKVTRREVIDVLLAWAGTNDGLLDSEAPLDGLMRAVIAEWPCE